MLVLSCLLLGPTQGMGTETCNSVLEKCDKALQETKKSLEISDLAVQTLRNQNQDLVVQVKELESSNSAWYKNPFLMIGLGLVVGVVIAK